MDGCLMGPLTGIKVLDLSRVLAGPWATQCLADFGATVWKIEQPGAGDDTRRWGPPWLAGPRGELTREAAYYLSANRGKRSLAIDISHPAGQRLIRELAARADVVVENFKVGGLSRHGLGWPDLRAVNPRLVYCSISAFGQDGPRANEAGYDAMIQAMSGLMSITGESDGPPQKVGVAVTDLMAGMYAVAAILAALHERARSGLGQHIDLALFDTQIAALANQGLNYLVSGRPPGRHGTAHLNIVPYQAFATADGHIMLAVGNDRQFASFCGVASSPELARDPRYATNSRRVANRTSLVPRIAGFCRQKSTREWVEALAAAQVPCGPINNIGEAFAEPQALHRRMRIDLPHALGGTVPQVRNPVLFSRTQLEYEAAPPLLGQHTEEVLDGELGLSADAIRALRASGAVS